MLAIVPLERRREQLAPLDGWKVELVSVVRVRVGGGRGEPHDRQVTGVDGILQE